VGIKFASGRMPFCPAPGKDLIVRWPAHQSQRAHRWLGREACLDWYAMHGLMVDQRQWRFYYHSDFKFIQALDGQNIAPVCFETQAL